MFLFLSFVRGVARRRGSFVFLLVVVAAPPSPPLPAERSSRSRCRISSREPRAAAEPPLVPLVVPLARHLLLLSFLHRDRRGVGLQQRAREPRAHGVVAGGDDRVEPGVEVLWAAPLLPLPLLGLEAAWGRRGEGGRGGGSVQGRRGLRESRPGGERRHRRRRRRRRRGRGRARIRT